MFSFVALFTPRNKKGRRTTPAPATPTKGRVEQYMADAPFGARSTYCFYTSRTRKFRLVVLREADIGRSRVVQIVGKAVKRL